VFVKNLLRSLGSGIGSFVPSSLRAMAISVALASTALATQASAFDVYNDTGGSVNARLAELNDLRARNEPVRILGSCLSACTLYLGLPRTCVSRSARLGFHGPRAATRGLPLPMREFERVSQIMASHYPPSLRRWFMQEARMRLEGYYEVSGSQAIRMGVRECA